MSEEPKKTGASLARGKSKQNYATPPDFMAAVHRRFGAIEFDLAADEGNKKSPLYYDEKADSLTRDWHRIKSTGGFLWLNPPFDDITPWAIKCASESALGAPPILFLTPASVGSNWYKQWVAPSAHVIFLNGRIHFDPNNPKWGYPKDCQLAVFYAGLTGTSIWTWNK